MLVAKGHRIIVRRVCCSSTILSLLVPQFNELLTNIFNASGNLHLTILSFLVTLQISVNETIEVSHIDFLRFISGSWW